MQSHSSPLCGLRYSLPTWGSGKGGLDGGSDEEGLRGHADASAVDQLAD